MLNASRLPSVSSRAVLGGLSLGAAGAFASWA